MAVTLVGRIAGEAFRRRIERKSISNTD